MQEELHGRMEGIMKVKEGFVGQRLIAVPENVKKTIKNNKLINSLYLTDIGFFPNARNHFRERRKGSKEYILFYCLEGKGVIELSGQKLELLPNTYCIVPPNIPCKYYAVKKNPWSIYWIHYAGLQSVNIYERLYNNGMPKVHPIPFIERRVVLFQHLIDVLEEGYSLDNVEFVNLSLYELINSFIYTKYFDERRTGDLSIIDESVRFMKENIEQVITVNDLAEKFNYSNSHFLRLFKNKTGYSPINYFNHLKIQKACQLLSFTDCSVKEISFKLGFDDPLYFSRLFKKNMNMSPLHYRKEFRA